jgi:two-component system, cell cycle sensor histidine kinase and response regulator CckA
MPEQLPQSTRASRELGTAITVLVIDDSDPHRRAIVRHLKAAGYRVREAATAREGLARAREALPDVIVLDNQLPDLSGFEVTQRLRADEHTAAIPILHLSAGFTEPESQLQDLDSGGDAYLTHPIDPPVLLGSVRAMIRAKRAEQGAHATARAWRATFDAISESVCVTDVGGRIVRYNRAFAELVGLAPTAVRGRALPDVLPPATHVKEPPFVRLGRGSPSEPFQWGSRWLRGSVAPLPSEEGHAVGAVCVIADVTAQKQADERLRHVQQLETTGRLAGGVAHEINNLMTIILGYSAFLLANMADGQARADLEQIHRAGARAAEIARQLLAYGRRQLTQPTVVEVNYVIRDMHRTLVQLLGPELSVELDLSLEPCRVYIDRTQLEQTVVNLALNARDAMRAGGRLTIRSRVAHLDPAIAAAHPDVEVQDVPYVEVSLTDTGHGMDAETLAHIFEPFYTTKAIGRGTGLGLAMAYGTIKQAGGYIGATSEPGVGSTFTIHLPLSAAPTTRESLPTAIPEFRPSGQTVLIVEDEPAVREVVRRTLAPLGFRVLEAADGAEALRILARPGRRVGLLITDVVMPGLSGPQLAAQVRASYPEVGILLTSGFTDTPTLRKHRLPPGEPLLQKPFAPHQLVAWVEKLLH